METEEKIPYLCDQYNKSGWAFRYPVITSIAFWLHDKTCPDLKAARAGEYDTDPEDFEPVGPGMTGKEFLEYLQNIDGEDEYEKSLWYQRGIAKGRTDLSNQILDIIQNNDHPIWSNENLQADLITEVRNLAK